MKKRRRSEAYSMETNPTKHDDQRKLALAEDD